MDLGDRQRPLLILIGHPRSDLFLKPQQLLPRRTVTIGAHRTHRLGDHPDQRVIDRADVVVAAQTRRVLDNLGAVLAAAGASFADVVKSTIFLVDMNDFAAVNAVYGERFAGAPPARSTVGVARLPKDARVEIEMIAVCGGAK